MKARELMSSDLDCVTPDDAITRAAQLMRDRDIGSLPVVESKDSMRLTGIITDRDITVRHVAEGHKEDCTVRDAMSTGELATVRPDDDERRVMEVMQSRQVRRVPVCEDGGRVIGVIAQADLALDSDQEDQVEKTVERISEPSRR